MGRFSDQITLENTELNNIKQFFKDKKRNAELIRALIRPTSAETVQEGHGVRCSPGGWGRGTACCDALLLITPADHPLKLPWAVVPAPVNIRMSREGARDQ